MKKYILPLVALFSMGFVSCSDDDDYQVGAQSEGCYFANDVVDEIYFDEQTSSFNLTLNRTSTDVAQTVALSISDESGLFNVPATVTFPEGETSTDFAVTFDNSKLSYSDYEVTISVAKENAYTYGVTEYTFVTGIDPQYRWEDLGECEYTDGFIAGVFSASAPTYKVPIQQHMSTSGLYRLVNPYGPLYPYYDADDCVDTSTHYLTIHAEYPNAVYINLEATGLDWGYGEMSTYSFAAYYMDNGYSLSAVANSGLCGTIVDGVITFPTKGLLLKMGTSLYYANQSDEFKVVLPTK